MDDKKIFMIFVRPEYDPVDKKSWTVSVKIGDIESQAKDRETLAA